MQATTSLLESFSEINYFPKPNSDSRIAQTEKEVQLKINVYNKVVGFLIADANFKEDIEGVNNYLTKDALAFFVEANSQQYPKDWKEQIDSVIEQIQEFRNEQPKEAYIKSTWLINDVLNILYPTSLAMIILNAQNQQNKKSVTFFNILLQSHNSNRKLKVAHQSDRPVSFGGINNHFIPEWYKKHFPANK